MCVKHILGMLFSPPVQFPGNLEIPRHLKYRGVTVITFFILLTLDGTFFNATHSDAIKDTA